MIKNVAVLMGGFSSEKDISFKSGEVIFKNIDKTKYKPFKIIIEKHKWYYTDKHKNEYDVCLNDFSITLKNKKIIFDAAFIIIHGSPGEDGLIQSYLELKNIPFTGSNSYVSSLTFNKRDCISVLNKHNIPSAKSVQLNFGQPYSIEKIVSRLGLPCFVKANRSGSSFGVFKVNKKEVLIYEPHFSKKTFTGIKVISDLDKFKENCDLIIANRVEDELRDVSSKIFTRDVFGNN